MSASHCRWQRIADGTEIRIQCVLKFTITSEPIEADDILTNLEGNALTLTSDFVNDAPVKMSSDLQTA